MGHFKLDMRPAVYERREPKRVHAAARFALIAVGAIVVAATAFLLMDANGEGISYLLTSVRVAR